MGSRERENAVQRMKDYIEEHITEPITLRMLADAPWLCAPDTQDAGKTAPCPS